MPMLELTDDEMRVVVAALIEAPLPWKITNPVLVKIQQSQQPQPTAAQLQEKRLIHEFPASKSNSDKKHERRLPDQP